MRKHALDMRYGSHKRSARIGHAPDMHWTCAAHVLSMCVKCVSHVLENIWVHTGCIGHWNAPEPSISALSQHRRRHVNCAGMGMPVLQMTASERRSFGVPARPYPRIGHAVGDADRRRFLLVLRTRRTRRNRTRTMVCTGAVPSEHF